jgi:hypothetical protein
MIYFSQSTQKKKGNQTGFTGLARKKTDQPRNTQKGTRTNNEFRVFRDFCGSNFLGKNEPPF